MRIVCLAVIATPLLWSQAASDLFETKIRPLLATRCHACHSGAAAMSGFRADSRESLLKGGSRGPALSLGDPGASLLLAAVRHTDPKLRMPPQAKLANAEIAALEHWIREGAPWPASPALKATGEHWSFRPLLNPGGDIDSLVRAKLRSAGLVPNAPASKRTLLRRASFDLTGLPPTRQEVEAFLADDSPGAWERAVDRLLASRHFGERWGRHWLDVARFGEEDFTGTQPKFYDNAWRYRDWVIGALNRDLRYDTFVKAQIAADLMPRGDGDLIGGLGLFGFGPWYYGISQPQQARADERNDRVDMITRGFLGLTGACARCHDHKYDPIATDDYYGLAGVFASSKYEEYPLAPAAEVERFKKAQAGIKTSEKELDAFLAAQSDQLAGILSHRIAEAMMAVASGGSAEQRGLDSEWLERWRKYLGKPEEDFPYLKPWFDAAARKADAAELRKIAETFQTLVIETGAAKASLDARNKAIADEARARKPKARKIVLPFGYDSDADFNPGADVPVESLDRDRAMLWRRFFSGKDALLRFEGAAVARFLGGEWKQHHDRLRAEIDRKKKESPEPYGFVQGLAEHEEPIDLPKNPRGNPFEDGDPAPRRFLRALSGGKTLELRQGSGRLQLAEAIVASPIAARVAANRAWMHMFGSGIVSTPSNFGRSGDPPSNPELLEHLASRLVAQGWSIKKLVRAIALSETYRASSDGNPANEKIDGVNRLFWRANRRRLDAESLRDSILAAAGALDLSSGGPSSQLDDKFRRRTVYARIGRFRQEDDLALFDFPSASASVEKRPSTNVPTQKLFFLNSPFVARNAKTLANRLLATAPSAEEQVRAAYEILYARPAEESELRIAIDYLSRGGNAWERYAQVLLSANEFAFID